MSKESMRRMMDANLTLAFRFCDHSIAIGVISLGTSLDLVSPEESEALYRAVRCLI